MNSERFILGDPRFLSGGGRATTIDYSHRPPTMAAGDAGVTSKEVYDYMGRHSCGIEDAVAGFQNVHRGLSGYHHRPPINMFLREGEEPTVGVEIETVARYGATREALESDLRSNWFHFERDGSLPEMGYELITEPLPPHVYRDPHVWAGLQNVLTPWVESFGYNETGLHVHVGLRQFEDIDVFGIPCPDDRRMVGKFLTVLVYFGVLGRAFVDRVMLRKNTGYCAATGFHVFQDFADSVRKGKGVTAGEAVDAAIRYSLCANAVTARAKESMHGFGYGDGGNGFVTHNEGRFSVYDGYTDFGLCRDHGGEGSEMNASHPYTVEFRRGKGTLHSLSVHRIVELTSLTVRYAAKIMRNPVGKDGNPQMVSPYEMYRFIAENTSNAALRQFAAREMDAHAS